jgi:CelD/BcsL family acetyltransferase involved in cellulose biosynthesis
VFEVAVEDSFDFLSPEYAGLFARSTATAFQHPAWLSQLYCRLLKSNGAQPLIVTVRRRSDKALVLLLPLLRRRYGALRVIEFADLRVSDYISVVADAATFEAMVADAALRRQMLAALKPYDLLRLGKLKDGQLPLGKLFEIAQADPMPMSAYASELGTSFDDWRATRLKQSYRKELDKKQRQLHRKGEVKFGEMQSAAEIAAAFEAMRVFRRDRFERNGGGELLQVPAYYEFYMAVARESGFARTYAMTIDGQPIAAALGLKHKDSLLVILGGFTQTEYKNQSIGSLMFQEIARDCIARGETVLDFTIGDEPYKLTFGAQPTPMWQVSRPGSPLGLAAAVMVDKLPTVRAVARQLFHPRGSRTEVPEAPAGDMAMLDKQPAPASVRS